MRVHRKIALAVLCVAGMIPAAMRAEHAFDIGIRGGIANLNARTTDISSLNQYAALDYIHEVQALPNLHAGAELSYSYLSPYYIGFRIGVTADRHSCAFAHKDHRDSYTIPLENNLNRYFGYSIQTLREDYTLWSVGIPLQAVVHGKGVRFSAGPKAVFPLQNTWVEKAQETTVYSTDPPLTDIIQEPFNLLQQNGTDVLPKVQWWLAGELTYTFVLHNAERYYGGLTVGAYFDYCFSSRAHTGNTTGVLTLRDPKGSPVAENILMTSMMEATWQGKPLVEQSTLYDVGIKIAYTIVVREKARDDERYGIHRGTRKKYSTGISDDCNCMP